MKQYKLACVLKPNRVLQRVNAMTTSKKYTHQYEKSNVNCKKIYHENKRKKFRQNKNCARQA